SASNGTASKLPRKAIDAAAGPRPRVVRMLRHAHKPPSTYSEIRNPVLALDFSASDKVYHFHAHDHFALLIEHPDKGPDDAAVRARPGAARFQDSCPDKQFIAGKNRLVPAQLVTAGRAQI